MKLIEQYGELEDIHENIDMSLAKGKFTDMLVMKADNIIKFNNIFLLSI